MILAKNISWEPKGSTWVTLHSSDRGLWTIIGQDSFEAGSGVRLASANLSVSRPDFTPHRSVARDRAEVVRLMTNSPLFEINAWEKRSLRTDI